MELSMIKELSLSFIPHLLASSIIRKLRKKPFVYTPSLGMAYPLFNIYISTIYYPFQSFYDWSNYYSSLNFMVYISNDTHLPIPAILTWSTSESMPLHGTWLFNPAFLWTSTASPFHRLIFFRTFPVPQWNFPWVRNWGNLSLSFKPHLWVWPLFSLDLISTYVPSMYSPS